MKKFLGGHDKGKALILMVGGAREALYTQRGVYKVLLSQRKGFVRIALETGTSLVPVISFGEAELYDQVELTGTLLSFQNLYRKITGIAPMIFTGRGVFQYSFGVVPRRHPLHVVGKVHISRTGVVQ